MGRRSERGQEGVRRGSGGISPAGATGFSRWEAFVARRGAAQQRKNKRGRRAVGCFRVCPEVGK
eukprot:311511-Prorocentrum_minimum.AAC.1